MHEPKCRSCESRLGLVDAVLSRYCRRCADDAVRILEAEHGAGPSGEPIRNEALADIDVDAHHARGASTPESRVQQES
jgi:hypothetical protein